MKAAAPEAPIDIGDWLNRLGLGEYESAFRENAVDLAILPRLTASDLKELGVSAIGHRKKLLAAIAQLSHPPIARLSGAAPAPVLGVSGAERRQLTVLVCDLVGSTALAARLDPEDMRAVISACSRCWAEAIERHEGYVAKYLGDGALAYFGYPEAHERDPELAVEAGLAIVQSTPKLETPAGSPLQVRVGIATGLVVVGELLGSGDSVERGVVGATPHLAARLQTIADPGQVVISETTRSLLGSLYEFKDLGCPSSKVFRAQRKPGRSLGRAPLKAVSRRFTAEGSPPSSDAM
jgi:class 3 adenylate cyclase